MSNEELIRATTQNATTSTPEAYEAIDEVLQGRSLDKQVYSAIEAQKKTYTIEEFDEYCNILQDVKCPFCWKTDYKLNGSMVADAVSIVIASTLTKRIVIGCPPQLGVVSRLRRSDR